MSKDKLLLGVLAGVAVGALLGVLFAPDKGSATREKISKKGKEYADDLNNKIDQLIASITSKTNWAEKEADELVTDLKSNVEAALKDLESMRK